MRGDYTGDLEEHLQEATNILFGDGGRMDAAPVILYGEINHIDIVATRAILDAMEINDIKFEAVAVKDGDIIVKDSNKTTDEIKQILEEALSENPAAIDTMYDYYLKIPNKERIPLNYM